jgi:nucleoside-diphosphate-sugar epimerase
MKVLVTGATGAIGPNVVIALSEAGYMVRTLSIDSPTMGVWSDNVETCIGDITDVKAMQSAMEGIDSVVHLAALLHVVNPPAVLQDKYERINVGGTSAMMAAAIRAGVKRVVIFSTIAVYGQSDGRILTEDSLPHPNTFYSQTKFAAENIVLEATSLDGRPIGTVLRLAAVYGSRIKGNYQRLLQSLARRRFIPIGNGANRRTLVYVKDTARAAVLALQHPAAAGKIFNISDGEFHTLRDIISTMCQVLGRKPPSFSLPIAPMRFAAGALENVSRLVGCQPPIVRETIDKYTEDLAVDSQLIHKELGFTPEYNLLAGWQAAIQEMKRSGELQL